MSADFVYQIISVVLIPIIVTIAKKLNLPSKWAPITAFGVALALVFIGKVLFNVELDVNTIGQSIINALATAGIAVLGYDQVKKLTETKK